MEVARELSVIEVPAEVLRLLPSQNLTKEELEDLDEEEWRVFSEIIRKDIPFGTWLRLTRSFKAHYSTLKLLEEQRALQEEACETVLHTLVENAVVKLFDGGEAVGTFVFITPAIGICALHQVYSDSTGIKESSLRVEKQSSVKFLCCFPRYDFAVYEVEGRKGAYLRLGRNSDLYAGNHITLVSYPMLDSQGRDDEEEEFTLTFGRISKESATHNPLCMLGQYPSFPNCSGGAIVSKVGCLLGLHIESVYHEAHGTYRPPKQPQGPDIIVHDKHWKALKSVNNNFVGTPPEVITQFAAENIMHKQSLGVFVPVNVLRVKFQECEALQATTSKRRRTD